MTHTFSQKLKKFSDTPPRGPKGPSGGPKSPPRGSKDLPKTPSGHQFPIYKLPINRKAAVTSIATIERKVTIKIQWYSTIDKQLYCFHINLVKPENAMASAFILT